jgi:hypothetical protein
VPARLGGSRFSDLDGATVEVGFDRRGNDVRRLENQVRDPEIELRRWLTSIVGRQDEFRRRLTLISGR